MIAHLNPHTCEVAKERIELLLNLNATLEAMEAARRGERWDNAAGCAHEASRLFRLLDLSWNGDGLEPTKLPELHTVNTQLAKISTSTP